MFSYKLYLLCILNGSYYIASKTFSDSNNAETCQFLQHVRQYKIRV